MIQYTTFGTADIKKAGEFYDQVLGMLGATRTHTTDHSIGWSTGKGQPMFCVFLPYNGEPATNGNGTMISLAATSPEIVKTVHAKALAVGGANEGDPGERGGGYYGAYFRDLDGNKLNLICINS